MTFTVTFVGLDELRRKASAAPELFKREVAKALYVGAIQVEKEAKQSILSGGKSGRIYTRRTVTHQASAPGEAPASDTGRLVGSIHTDLDTASLTSTVKASTKYATPLEFGTSKMAARPFMFPALEKSKQFISDRLKTAFQSAINQAGSS